MNCPISTTARIARERAAAGRGGVTTDGEAVTVMPSTVGYQRSRDEGPVVVVL